MKKYDADGYYFMREIEGAPVKESSPPTPEEANYKIEKDWNKLTVWASNPFANRSCSLDTKWRRTYGNDGRAPDYQTTGYILQLREQLLDGTDMKASFEGTDRAELLRTALRYLGL